MSDYFGNLAARALGLAVTARPRKSLFEPRPGAIEPQPPAPEDERVPAVEPRSTPAPKRQLVEPAGPPELEDRPDAAKEELEPERPVSPSPRRKSQQRRAPVAARSSAEEPSVVRPRPAPRQRRAPELLSPPEAVEPPAEVLQERQPARPLLGKRPPPLLATPAPRPSLRREESRLPTVRVTIGRVDVRAVTPEKPREPKPKPKPRPAPRMSLDEYLTRDRRRAG